jgi:hypothetical protein
VLFFVELPPIIVLGVVANVAFVYRDDQSIVYDELKTPFMNERNQKINSKWNIVDNKSVVYNINIDKQYMRAEQAESEGRFAAASL